MLIYCFLYKLSQLESYLVQQRMLSCKQLVGAVYLKVSMSTAIFEGECLRVAISRQALLHNRC